MHNIDYWSVEEKCDRGAVLCDIEDVARRNGDGYSGPLKWHDEVSPLKNREEAEKWIQAHAKGWYDDHAVRYYDYSRAKITKKIEEMQKKNAELGLKIAEYQKKHSVKNFKANFIGCDKCGSKVARVYLRSDKCPVCGDDLRSVGVIAGENELYHKRAVLLEKIKEETEKQEKNRDVRWLVKFEYHS